MIIAVRKTYKYAPSLLDKIHDAVTDIGWNAAMCLYESARPEWSRVNVCIMNAESGYELIKRLLERAEKEPEVQDWFAAMNVRFLESNGPAESFQALLGRIGNNLGLSAKTLRERQKLCLKITSACNSLQSILFQEGQCAKDAVEALRLFDADFG